MLCSTIATRPDAAGAVIDRLQKSIDEHQQQIQERFLNTYMYITKQKNQNQLKAGNEDCEKFFDGLKIPLSTDLQNNKEWLQSI
ncbi:unnamed protein product, partial [Rotaria sp. Silwood1]